MRKVILLGFICITSLFAGIGENFEKGGYWIGGDGTIGVNSIGNDSYFYISLGAVQDFYVRDNLFFGFRESFLMAGSTPQYLSLTGRLGYTFITTPDESRGATHTLGMGIGSTIRFVDTELGGWLLLNPFYRFNYFLTDRIAPYVMLDVPVSYSGNYGWDFNTSLHFGLAVHFPVKMRVNIPKE